MLAKAWKMRYSAKLWVKISGPTFQFKHFGSKVFVARFWVKFFKVSSKKLWIAMYNQGSNAYEGIIQERKRTNTKTKTYIYIESWSWPKIHTGPKVGSQLSKKAIPKQSLLLGRVSSNQSLGFCCNKLEWKCVKCQANQVMFHIWQKFLDHATNRMAALSLYDVYATTYLI